MGRQRQDMGEEVICLHPLPHRFKAEAIRIYACSLAAKLEPVLGPLETSIEQLMGWVDLDNGIGALWRDQVVGILGLQHRSGGFCTPRLDTTMARYGVFATSYLSLLATILAHEVEEGELYLDGIAVVADRRGQGIGGQLISAFESYASKRAFKRLTVEVIDTHPQVRDWYSRLGYQEVGSRSVEALGIFSFRSVVTMQKEIVSGREPLFPTPQS